MAISPSQITEERDEFRQKQVERCEAQIDDLLRKSWCQHGRPVDITDIVARLPELTRSSVLANYEKNGWKIGVRQTDSHCFKHYEISEGEPL